MLSSILALGACLILLVGCAAPTGEVSGKVTYKGQAVTNGSINFDMKGQGIGQQAKLDANGAFTLEKPMPVGTYQVFYAPPTPEPQPPGKGPPAAIKSMMPEKFYKAESSGVTVDVKAGKNDNITVEFKD